MKRALHCAFALLFAFTASAQCEPVGAVRDTTRILYDDGFDLHEGLYLSAKDLLCNRPSIPTSSLVNKRGKPITGIVDSNSKTWPGKVFQRIGQGERKAISMNGLWGFCDKDHVYIKVPSSFQIGFKGSRRTISGRSPRLSGALKAVLRTLRSGRHRNCSCST